MSRRRARGPWIVLAGFVALVAVLRPWTIRPIGGAAHTFDAHAYVGAIWSERVVPAAESSSIDISKFVASLPSVSPSGVATGPKAVFVKGTAAIVDIDRRSRVGLARIELLPLQGLKTLPTGPDVRGLTIQIGPVIRGTALRDALPFIRFTDFVNQLEFAEVSSALNDAVGARVLKGIDLDQMKGRTVTFVGAVATGAARGDDAIGIVPVRLVVGGVVR